MTPTPPETPLGTASRELVVPHTGQLIDLSNPLEVAQGLQQLEEHRKLINDIRNAFIDALRIHCEHQGTRTLHLDGVTVVLEGGRPETVYPDADALALELELAGLPIERVNQALPWKRKPDGRVLRQLAAANPDYAQIIAKHAELKPRSWWCTFK